MERGEVTGGGPADVRCRGCGVVLAQSTPRELWVGPVAFARTVTVRCRACGRHFGWSPSPDSAREEA